MSSSTPISSLDTMPTTSSLAGYLQSIRRLLFQPSNGLKIASVRSTPKITLVMGNPSADLDSFISAVVFSYFYNRQSRIAQGRKDGDNGDRSDGSEGGRIYVPLLDLSHVPSSDLWRQRPEFGVAMRSAIANEDLKNGADGKKVLGNLLTLGDILSSTALTTEGSHIRDIFTSSRLTLESKQQLVLVDHNAPSIPIPATLSNLSWETLQSRFDVVGVIDHHVDESYVPTTASPRIVTIGIGSCTSLVVQHLRDKGYWPAASPSSDKTQPDDQGDNAGLSEIAHLALAPILIDTSKLRATGDKCSDTDREAVAFLEEQIKHVSSASIKTTTTHKGSVNSYNRDSLFDALSTAKSNSLDLLNMQEILERDYKDWTETTVSPSSKPDQKEIKLGISSLVQPISWLSHHAESLSSSLTDSIASFASKDAHDLNVLALLTRTGHGGKEIAVFSFAGLDPNTSSQTRPSFSSISEGGVISTFKEKAGAELDLQAWKEEDGKTVEAMTRSFGSRGVNWQIWQIGDTSKSRKQVGPLLREVVRGDPGGVGAAVD